MSRKTSKLQVVLYLVFLVTCLPATVIGVLALWGVETSKFVAQVGGTCIIIAFATALTMSATRLVSGPPPEDDR